MATDAPSTVRARRLRKGLSRGIAMVADVEVGEGGIHLLVRNRLASGSTKRVTGKPSVRHALQLAEGRGTRPLNPSTVISPAVSSTCNALPFAWGLTPQRSWAKAFGNVMGLLCLHLQAWTGPRLPYGNNREGFWGT